MKGKRKSLIHTVLADRIKALKKAKYSRSFVLQL